jgi:indole-3-glycerol phosphate synthase
MPTYLDKILAAHREAARTDRRDLDQLVAEAGLGAEPRGFRAALGASPAVAVIAEIKRRSPSKGLLAPDLDPALLAKTYAGAGAACLSVLTDTEFFAGSADDLTQARSAVDLPVLRKDFTVSPADVCDARLMGADAVLLIVAALTAAELGELVGTARRLGLDALVEVHDEAEAAVALGAGAELIGVNQRDLLTFEVDTERAVRVARFDAVLVGEALVTSGDPGAALAALTAVEAS